MMNIKFWGTRGSIPTPLTSVDIKQKIHQALSGATGLDLTDPNVIQDYLDRLPFQVQGTIGGNTTCVEIRVDDQLLIIDAGSGVRLLGGDLMAQGYFKGGLQADFLITHTHWDHIHGFPFFGPAFIPGNQLTFHSPFADMEDRLNRQQEEAFFPVDTKYMQAEFLFNQLQPETWHQIGKLRVYPMRLSHPGETYGYRIETDSSCLVFASDSEYKRLNRESTEAFVSFFQDADLLIFDTQYSLTEVLDKPDWGHSSALMGAELAHRAGVKQLMLFHHDPTSSDDKIFQAQEEAEAYLQRAYAEAHHCKISIAYEGLSIEI
ncbi:MAG: MBL fold metallo-hydrolase [Chloroflexota bacterium]